MYLPPPDLADHDPHAAVDRVPYAELHVHSNFSFLDGASHPEELIEEAARLRLDAVALTDHDGLYGAVRFATAGRALGVSTVFGAELTLGLQARPDGEADPLGEHLLVLARGPAGYSRLSRVISSAHLRGAEKSRPRYDEDELAAELTGHAVILTGCRKGAVRRGLADRGAPGARDALTTLVDRFGRDAVVVELTDHTLPLDSTHNDLLAGLAAELGLPTVATGNVHYHAPQRATLADALAAIRARRGLDDMEGWLPAAGMSFLRSGDEMAEVMHRYPGAVARAAALGMYPQTWVHSKAFVGTNVPTNVGTQQGVCGYKCGPIWGYTPRMAENMEPFKFRVRPSKLAKAQRIAEKRGENLSEVLREGLDTYIRENAHLLPADEDSPEGERPTQDNKAGRA